MVFSVAVRSRRRWWSRHVLLCLWLACVPVLALAQPASEASVKTGFTYNFIKFTQWPAGREGQVLRLCAVSARPLEGQLERLQGRSVGTRLIEVRTSVPSGEWRQCDVLFFAEGDASSLTQLPQRLGHAPVLTLGDLPGFVESGGMIGMRLADDRVRFDVNLGQAQRAGLGLNSQMLQLAGRVLP